MYELSLNNSICGSFQDRGDINYLHPGLLFFNKDLCFDLHTIDFGGGHINGVSVDVGGQTHFYINRNDIKVKYIQKDIICDGMEDITNNHVFYHMIDGSNWSNKSEKLNNLKIEKIKKIIYS